MRSEGKWTYRRKSRKSSEVGSTWIMILKAIVRESDTRHMEEHSRKRNRMYKGPENTKPGFKKKKNKKTWTSVFSGLCG